MKLSLSGNLVLVIFCLSTMTESFPAIAEEGKAGRIEVVGPASIDFGKYPAEEKKVADYRIRNSGSDILKIIKIRKTCGCAEATCSKEELKPQEEATVKVVILPDSIFGTYSKTTFVESSDPTNGFLSLIVMGNAVRIVDIKPQDYINAGRIMTNQQWSQLFELKGRDPSVKLGNPMVESNYKVETTFTNIAGSVARYSLGVKILPADKSGDLNCSISMPVLFPTNCPPVKIVISAKVDLELCAIPGTIYLPASGQDVERTFTLRLLDQHARVLDPNSLKLPENPDISFAVRQDSDGKGLLVTARFTPEFIKQLFTDEVIPLSFEVPGAASAQVVCKRRKNS